MILQFAGDRPRRRTYAVNDEAREFLVTWEELARPGPVSPMTEFRAQPLESAGEAAEILRREVAGTPTWPGGWRT